MSLTDKLAAERRARLAAERMLDLKSRELFEANRKLSKHALKLSDQIVEQREQVQIVQHEAAELKDQHERTQAQLMRAEKMAEIHERRLWDSVESIGDGFSVFDSQDRLIAANSAWLSLFDYSDVIQPGIPYLEIIRFAAEEGIFDIGESTPSNWISDMLDRWDNSPVPEVTIQLWNGQYYRLMDQRSRDGDMVCLAVDITQMKLREEELRDARLRAEAANRTKSAFLANMSHELRTPMNGVVAMVELLLEGDLDDEQQLFLRTIRNSGESLLSIINDVLDFSKLEADKMQIRSEPFDMERMLHEVLTLVAPMAREKKLDLHVDYDLFLPTRLIGDSGRIRQVLTNLIGNAVKFTMEGHVLIRVVGIESESGDWQIHVTVEDTGIGIAPEMQQNIFESFAQEEQEKNRSFEGTGLGLAICRQIVERMGGQIWVESEKGKGSCFGFRLSLPCNEKLRSQPYGLEPGLDHAMMVGDCDLDQEILSRQLRQLGMEVRCAPNGSAALDEISRGFRPQMVMIDERLPDVSSSKLAVALRQAGLHSATVLLCADRANLNPSEARDSVDAVLSRPILRSELFRTLAGLPVRRAPHLEPSRLIEPVSAPADTPAPATAPMPPSDPLVTPEHTPVVRPRTTPIQPAAVAPAPEPVAPSSPAPQAVPPSAAPKVAPPVSLAEGAAAPAFASRRHSRPLPTQQRQMRVLAAEDNRTNQFVFRKLVKALDIDLTIAANGREAVDFYEELNPDLVFMDISMPVMDGREATREIRRLEAGKRHVPIVAMTAHALSGDKEEILQAGLDHYLTKPMKKAVIMAIIREACPSDCRPPAAEQPAVAE